MSQLEGAFALIFKSRLFPNQVCMMELHRRRVEGWVWASARTESISVWKVKSNLIGRFEYVLVIESIAIIDKQCWLA